MKEQFLIYTSKNGKKYIQTKSKYLAHALSYCCYQFMTFQDSNGVNIYSFEYSEELLEVINSIIELRRNNLVKKSNNIVTR